MNSSAHLLACASPVARTTAATTTTTTAATITNVVRSNRRPAAVFTSYLFPRNSSSFSSRRGVLSPLTPQRSLVVVPRHHLNQQLLSSNTNCSPSSPSSSSLSPTKRPAPTPANRRAPPPLRTMSSSSSSTSLIESAKRAACQQAVADNFDPSFKYVGIGSGSTVAYVVEAIAARGPEVTSRIKFVPSGSGSAKLVRDAGLTVLQVPELLAEVAAAAATATPNRQYIDVYFDGADEVDPELAVIKGGGACLFQEKLVARLSKKFVCVADSRKRAARLLTNWAYVPVEVSPVAAELVRQALVDLGSEGPAVRTQGPGAAPGGTDNHNYIIDAPFPPLLLGAAEAARLDPAAGSWTPDALAAAIKGILGVLEVGIFAGPTGPQAAAQGPGAFGVKPVKAYFGNADGGVETLG